jgi:uncharacterized cofD-like protein
MQNLQRDSLRLLTPGLSIKRWLLMMVIGVTLIGLGFAYFAIDLYRDAQFPQIVSTLTLQFLPRALRGLLLVGLGALAFGVGLWRFNRTLLGAIRGADQRRVVDALWDQRKASAGPKVVAIGGGHGLGALLSGLKHHTNNITAIVTVADDGGSSGRLRRDLGVLPPGDFRMCISALADNESLVTQLMQYRFASGDGLAGHSFGNLFIAALAQVTGSFEKALVESSRVVASKGRIIPSTLSDVVLCAEYRDSQVQARGESSIGKQGLPIERVWLEPGDPPVYPEAVKALLEADLVVIGPGSLWTSLMPNLLVRGLIDVLKQIKAPIVYVANITTERGETDGFTLGEHIDAIERHIGRDVVDFVLINNRTVNAFKPPSGVDIIDPDAPVRGSAMQIVRKDLVSDSEPWRHNSAKLAEAVMAMSGSA